MQCKSTYSGFRVPLSTCSPQAPRSRDYRGLRLTNIMTRKLCGLTGLLSKERNVIEEDMSHAGGLRCLFRQRDMSLTMEVC